MPGIPLSGVPVNAAFTQAATTAPKSTENAAIAVFLSFRQSMMEL
jgi:hypothetical protein